MIMMGHPSEWSCIPSECSVSPKHCLDLDAWCSIGVRRWSSCQLVPTYIHTMTYETVVILI